MALAAVAAVAAMLGAYQWGHSRPPRIVLWAWERPENLEFIDPGRIGVAFLARTIRLELNETL
ncbi:MAG TPA: hypothetical protein VJ302_15540, partial [Blastocatellia bacterium]|nr:hypothetical protein [Blastocatellia bacterium]